MAAPTLVINTEEFRLFHEIDRKLFTILTKDLWRDPMESMRIMALWLWLERSGISNLVKRISSLHQFLINELADEAVTCLNYLNTNPLLPSSEPSEIPLTQSLMDSEISIRYFNENRLTAIQGMAKIITDVCTRALMDLTQQAIERNAVNHVAETQMLMSSLVQPGFVRLGINGGGVGVVKPVTTKAEEVHPDDRTMFVTFSKGYPVAEREIREFFTASYGDCVESVHMQEAKPGEQSLFARIVLYLSSAIPVILRGADKAKITINGKHVWMRKFVPKRQSSSSPTPLLPRPDMPGGASTSLIP